MTGSRVLGLLRNNANIDSWSRREFFFEKPVVIGIIPSIQLLLC